MTADPAQPRPGGAAAFRQRYQAYGLLARIAAYDLGQDDPAGAISVVSSALADLAGAALEASLSVARARVSGAGPGAFPREQVGKAFSAFGPAMGVAAVGGPILAGFLIHADLNRLMGLLSDPPADVPAEAVAVLRRCATRAAPLPPDRRARPARPRGR